MFHSVCCHAVDVKTQNKSLQGDPKVATTTSWSPSQLECDGDRAVEFYAALLKFAMYWNSTLATEHAMSIAVPSHGIDIGNFVKHAIVREMYDTIRVHACLVFLLLFFKACFGWLFVCFLAAFHFENVLAVADCTSHLLVAI